MSGVRSRGRVVRAAFALCAVCAGLFPAPLAAQDRNSFLINGNYTSSFDIENRRTYPQGGGAFAQGWFHVLNLRLKSTVSESLSFFVSTNITAPTGFYAEALGPDVQAELERLYFKAGSETFDLEAGLIRVARGYGYVFSPLDFLNPRDAGNSLDPQGRPPGKWGVHASFFPGDLWRVDLFGLAGDDATEDRLWGSRLGAGTTFSVDRFTYDALYALLLPEVEPGASPAPAYLSDDVTQIAAIALKADMEVGLFAEALYRVDHRALKHGDYYGKSLRGYEGLEAAAGVDYTFGWRDLYVLGEYLFYGPGHVDWQSSSLDPLYTTTDWQDSAPLDRLSLLDDAKRPLLFARHDYLFLLARLTLARDLKAGASCLGGLDDLSALFTVFAQYEALQGLTLELRYLQPVDRRLFDSSAAAGEWGSTVLGFHQMVGLAAKVRF